MAHRSFEGPGPCTGGSGTCNGGAHDPKGSTPCLGFIAGYKPGLAFEAESPSMKYMDAEGYGQIPRSACR